jgi:hypothetical protein
MIPAPVRHRDRELTALMAIADKGLEEQGR